jgi:hypothetical protein
VTTTIITGTTLHSSVTLGSGNYPGPLTITNTGGIHTSGTGATALAIIAAATATNAGDIKGGVGSTPAYAYQNPRNGGAGGYGVQIAVGMLSNSGRITGGTGGETNTYPNRDKDGTGGAGLSQSGGFAVNYGTITGGTGGTGNVFSTAAADGGDGGYGVILSGGTFINAGTIIGGAAGAAFNYHAAAGNGGNGVEITGGVFIDNGAIKSHGAGIVVSGSNTATVVIESGASFTDDDYGNDGNATLAVGGTTPFVLSGISQSQQFVNFRHLSFASTLSGFGLAGDASGLANGQTIDGFAAGDNITLTGFAATSTSFVSANHLVLKNSSGTTETLDLTGLVSTGQLHVSSSGGNTTLTALASTISTAITPGVTIGTGTIASFVTVTSTGAVTGAAGVADSVSRIVNNQFQGGGAGGSAVVFSGSAETVINSGSLTGGAGGAGFGNSQGGSGSNGGAGGSGAAVGGADTLANYGAITGGQGGAAGFGAGQPQRKGAGGTGVTTNGAASIANFGTITGGLAGAGDSNTGGGAGLGVALGTTGQLTNAGQISGAKGADNQGEDNGASYNTGYGGTAISLAGSGQLTNLSGAAILGGNAGSNNALTNVQGGQSGAGGAALISNGNDTITNQGTIIGGTGGAVGGNAASGSGGDGLDTTTGDFITNTGTIAGGTGGDEGNPSKGPEAGGIGVQLNGGTLINAGLIFGGDSGGNAPNAIQHNNNLKGQSDAVLFGANAATLIIETGASFSGNVVANASVADVLAFAGTSSLKFSGIGTQEQNFNQISFTANAAWTIEGNATGLVSGQTISGFTSTDHIILDSFAAISETLNAGKLTLSNGILSDVLNLGASTDNFVVQNNGTNSTISAAPASISLATGTYIISGHKTGLTGTSITGFAIGDTIDLEGFAATSETCVSGVGLVLGTGTTLAINSLATGVFLAHTDGTNTTIVASPPISIISTSLGSAFGTSNVSLGNGAYATSLTVTSSGSVQDGQNAAIYAGSGLTGLSLTNHGLVDGSQNNNGGVAFDSAGYINNTGRILAGGNASGIYLQNGGTIVNTGSIDAGGGDGIYLKNAGTVINSGYIHGRIGIYSKSAFTLIENPGGGSISGSPQTASKYSNSSLVLGGTSGQSGSLYVGQSGGFSNISFTSGVAWDISTKNDNHLTGVQINGFAQGDVIDLEGFTAQSSHFANGQLTLTGTYRGFATFASTDVLNISGNFTPANFYTASDGNGGTNLTALCYLRGTKILTPDGEKPIETLCVGDEVCTRFGGVQKIKFIGRQSYAPAFLGNNKAKWPVTISAGALGDGFPTRDLSVSPGHSMLIGETLVLAKNLINGITIRQDRPETQIDYFQLEFCSHDCVQAEGTWSESFADGPGLRAQFHNVAEFWARYPDYVTPEALALCAPRPEHGPALAAALAPVLARTSFTPGPLTGCIDVLDKTGIQGWAQDSANPDLPVALEIRLSGRPYATILACDYRADLAESGIGNGNHAFFFKKPLLAFYLPHLTIHRLSDGAEIFRPRHITQAA